MKKITFLSFLLVSMLGYSQVVEDFEGAAPTINFFDGADTANIVADPGPGSNMQDFANGDVLQLITNTAGNPWQGTQLIFQGDVLDLSTTDKVVSIDVYSDTALSLLAKLDGEESNGAASATDANHPGGGWVTLNFDFSDNLDGTAVANGVYTNIIFYPAWENLGGTCNAGCYSTGSPGNTPAETIYVDNIDGIATAPGPTCSDGMMNGNETGVDCGGPDCAACPNPPSAPPTTPPNRAPGDVISVFSDAYTDVATEQREAFGDAVVTELDFSGNMIISATTPLAGAGFQYQYFGSNLDLSGMSHMHIDFYFEGAPSTAGTFFTVIAQYNGGSNAVQNNIDVTSLASNTWHEIDVTFDSFASGQPRDQIQQVIVQINGPDIYGPFYVDNIYFHNNTLSTDEFTADTFKVSPNPTNSVWNVSGTSVINNVAVYDILGKQVLALEPNSNDFAINASSLRTGVYFAKIETANGSKTIKLVRE